MSRYIEAEIRKDCFWYRPWKDMSATFHQCHLKDIAKECDGMCEMFIHNNVVDKLIYKICNTPKYNSVLVRKRPK